MMPATENTPLVAGGDSPSRRLAGFYLGVAFVGCMIGSFLLGTTRTVAAPPEGRVELWARASPSNLKGSTTPKMTPAQVQRTDGRTVTPGGRPLPFAGKAMVTSRVIKKTPGASHHLKKYPSVFKPGEELAPDEMRLVCTGSGNPIVRRGQAAASWTVMLGNGDNFVFDVGGGSVQNIYSLGVHPSLLDKVFITHGHLDHIGDLLVLFDAMGWARNTPLHVWGSTAGEEDEGITAILDGFQAAAKWHVDSKRGLVPSTGAVLVPHEIDYSQYSPENPEVLAYDENGVKIYAFPVQHCIAGAIGYRLEWNGLSATFHGDGEPTMFEAERAKGVDVMIHEGFLDAPTFSKKADIPLAVTKSILRVHTTPSKLGRLFDVARPRLGVGYHYFLDDETIDPFFDGVAGSYSGPVSPKIFCEIVITN